MMDIRQCKECGKLFQYISKPICQDCIDAQDQMFIKVRDYLYQHPAASIEEVSEKTEVEERFILEFLKEERLSVDVGGGYLTCENCGTPIEKGRYCESCKNSLGQALQSTLPGELQEKNLAGDGYETRHSGGMHLDYRNKK
ncbi:flagellar protein [Eubacteriales bacterium OttesenSCG-928-M02]|nr:flagellar protein [Eubacteriales bacterium OttesenSCG-928-M02]